MEKVDQANFPHVTLPPETMHATTLYICIDYGILHVHMATSPTPQSQEEPYT